MSGVTFDFTDARVVVTGAAGLIGRDVVRSFAEASAHVLATDLPEELTSPLVRERLNGLSVVTGDLTEEAFLDALVDQAAREGPVDVLVNCAAVTAEAGGFLETTATQLDRRYRVNLRAVHGLSLRVARGWLEAGRGGVIVNFSSPGASRAHHDESLYDATKGAVEALSRAMAVELGVHGIRVNCVSPASIGTDGQVRADTPMRTAVSPADVADAVMFLASPAARRVTGHVLSVDAGLLAQLRSPTAVS